MAFKITQQVEKEYPDPEALFADIKQKKIRGLLSHQADIIRNYVNQGIQKEDISIQLSTGAGKTLIGLLIGEWLRQKNRERVLYLCPTNQLVFQVCNQAKEQYGIECCPFVGSKNSYSAGDKDLYLSAKRIGITSYSSLFNVKPFFNDPNVIILDDVHQAEWFINSLWSVRIQKENEDHEDIYNNLLSLLREYIPSKDFDQTIRDASKESPTVDKVPSGLFQKMSPKLIELLDDILSGSDQRYPWQMIKSHLNACHLYYSINEILIKPLYPPTFSFPPFSSARQRIYMSATMGNGGDLERIVGRRNIFKLEIPEHWLNRTVGRRFFCFPEVSLKDDEVNNFLLKAVSCVNRKVYIAPSKWKIESVEDKLSELPDLEILHINDIESGKDPFITASNCILLLASRYDGIDFPDDECRLLIIDGLPKAMNLQEYFLIHKLGQSPIFHSRIITRITQAFGRSTRSTTDYSVVLVIGNDLVTLIQKIDLLKYLLPELRAEIEFGLEQSRSVSAEEVIENIGIFLQQNAEWKSVDTSILQMRDKYLKEDFPNSKLLLDIADSEIKYSEAIWNDNYTEALNECKNILGKAVLPELRGVRGFWSYLSGSVTHLLNLNEVHTSISPETFFSDASKAAPALTWLHRIKLGTRTPEEIVDLNNLALIDRIENEFQRLGTKNSYQIEKLITDIKGKICIDTSNDFENGQVLLGRILGYDSGKIEEEGSPDPWWQVNTEQCFVFEDYTEGLVTSELSVTKARQASSHEKWIRARLNINKEAKVYCFIIAKITKTSESAAIHLENVSFINTHYFRELSLQSLAIIKELWSLFPGPGDLFWRQRAIEKMKEMPLSSNNLIELFNKNNCNKILTIVSN